MEPPADLAFSDAIINGTNTDAIVDAKPCRSSYWVLEKLRHHFRLAHEGRQALAVAREFRPDVIILDIGLPGMDGYAVCRAFREDELFKTTPIIAQSGWGQTHDKMLASEAGFDHHLTKPITRKELERVLLSVTKQDVQLEDVGHS